MGGGLILVAMVVATLLWADLSSRFVWILLAHHARLRRHRLLRRLPEARGRQLQGPRGALQVSRAVGWRPCARRSALHGMHQSPAETSLYVPFFKTVAVPMSTAGFVVLRLLRDRRHQQRGEPHRRARRPRDHAGGDGGGGARRVRLRHRQRQVRHATCRSPTSPASARC